MGYLSVYLDLRLEFSFCGKAFVALDGEHDGVVIGETLAANLELY